MKQKLSPSEREEAVRAVERIRGVLAELKAALDIADSRVCEECGRPLHARAEMCHACRADRFEAELCRGRGAA